MNDQRSLISHELEQALPNLMASVGEGTKYKVYPLSGGANNRVFRVEVNGSSALLKSYFYHPSDPRDRLGAEFAFSKFAWENGVRSLPRPLACDHQHRLGLYEFVQGRRLMPGEITKGIVAQAIAFFRELNRFRNLPGAQNLPLASEACFTISDHIRCVEGRFQRLRSVEESEKINREAYAFIRNELADAWRKVTSYVRERAQELGLALESEIALQDRRLSPSDFGFHNALLTGDNQLRFIDFEYAGWDDPAKIVCDFFCQPAVPVPLEYFNHFVEILTADLLEPEMHRQRIALLLPVYQIKWCCILLNDFLPVDSKRRRFARDAMEPEQQKAEQLRKTRRALDMLVI